MRLGIGTLLFGPMRALGPTGAGEASGVTKGSRRLPIHNMAGMLRRGQATRKYKRTKAPRRIR